MDSVIKIIGTLTAIIFIACAVFFIMIPGTSPSSESVRVTYFFYGEECDHCHDVMPFIINMSRKYPEANITILEIWDNESNQETVADVHVKLNKKFVGVPEVVIGDVVLLGTQDIEKNMEQEIQYNLGMPVRHGMMPNQNFPKNPFN